MKKTVAIIAFSAVLGTLQGCATPASIQGMTAPRASTSQSDLANSISVTEVSGGKKTNPLWTSQISSTDFDAALKASLKSAGLLSTDKGRYTLSATLVALEQPAFGLDMTVTSHVMYTLTDTVTGRKLLEETIVAPHTATVGEAFVAVKRLRLANEGSVRQNIDKLITRIETLKVDGVSVK
ncbi:hypothetical protein EV700_1897 [Fluviicoccus keumensis]|uniref:LPS-assembly lipoprotein n=1 Tax=Fluviicoccus keumensis TaxID=1435465 RepID=A0A4Q7Z5Y0_9GAMM|nr:hypothetical protein [Fluviicoccus keumensis]RZU45085.1 hypothetical protein EV700_1897 [Fluviicoccus keumensis]